MPAQSRSDDRLSPRGALLAEWGFPGGQASPAPAICPSPDGQGFLVARDAPLDLGRDRRMLERHGPPWSIGPTTPCFAIGSCVRSLELDDSGRYLAAALSDGGTRVALWDTHQDEPIAEISHGDPVTWIGFTPAGPRMISISASDTQGQVVLTPVGGGDSRVLSLGGVKLAAVNPSGDTLVAADSLQRLSIIDLSTGRVRHEIDAPFGEEEVRRYFDSPGTRAALRREMRDVRKVFEETGLPPGFASIKELMERFERDYAEYIRKACDQAVRAGPPGGIYRMPFDPSGERLYLGTMAGLRAYSWRDLAVAGGSLPEPVIGMDPSDPSGRGWTCHGYVYDLEFDPDRARVVLAGGDGCIRFLEPSTGGSGVLLQLSGRPPIRRLALSRDRTALALVAHPEAVSPPRAATGPVLQFWDYRRLADSS